MANIWHGTDPAPDAGDFSAQEMGSVVQALEAGVTLTGARIFLNAATQDRVGRSLKAWNMATEAVMFSKSLPESLSGIGTWQPFLFTTPYEMSKGEILLLSWDVQGYCFVGDAFNDTYLSVDGAMAFPRVKNARFGSAGSFPTNSFHQTFHGVDAIYSYTPTDVLPPVTPGALNLNTVMDEVAERLDMISGLRVFAYPPPKVTPPAAIVSYPGQITFDATYGRGMDRIPDLSVVIVEGRPTDRGVRERIAAYAAGAGSRSVKAVLESGTYTALDTIRVTGCEFDVVTIAAVDYIAAVFTVDISGRGS